MLEHLNRGLSNGDWIARQIVDEGMLSGEPERHRPACC
jgi:hypothetical protein